MHPPLSPPAKGAVASNGADHGQLGYDVRGLVVSRRMRDGNMIRFAHDALGRVIFKDLPNTAPHEHDIGYAHDNLGRLTGGARSSR